MCNIAAYVGTKQAAPILVEMLRKQEGWDSGYYTGIATIHEGEFHLEKGVGSMEMLLSRTDVTKLPGTIGFIHGRSKGSEKNDNYAHPFEGTGGDILYMANGYGGIFRKFSAGKAADIFAELSGLGYHCKTYMEGEYTMLPGGAKIHSSDLKCQKITYYVDQGMSVMEAMEKTLCERPSEVVGLVLNRKTPDRIHFARMNYPMFIGIADHGIYMATTPMVFPEDARDITLLQPMSCGEVYRDRYMVKPFAAPPATVAPLTPEVYSKCYTALVEALSKEDMDHDQIDRFLRPMIPGGDCPPESALDYMILHDLQKQGKLEIKKQEMPGVVEGTIRTKFIASLK